MSLVIRCLLYRESMKVCGGESVEKAEILRLFPKL